MTATRSRKKGNSAPVSEKPGAPDPWIWIEGLGQQSDGAEAWFKLYCYREQDVLKARHVLRQLLSMATLPRELEPYEDFRLSETPPESPQEPAKPVPAQPPRSESPKPLRATQRAKCDAELRGQPCVRRSGHYPTSMHKTSTGRKWKSRK